MLLVVCMEGSGRRGFGGRWRDDNDTQRSYEGRYIVVVSLLGVAIYLCFSKRQDMGLDSVQHQ